MTTEAQVLDDFLRAREAIRATLGIPHGVEVEDLRDKPWRIETRPLGQFGDLCRCLDVKTGGETWTFWTSRGPGRPFEVLAMGDLTIVRDRPIGRPVAYVFTTALNETTGA